MFYSHEILTSPEHGVASIWLVATLGSKSIARKLNRKAIQDVDVPRACDVIVNPEAPMALRLQGSLLYGVSRVYNQQCGYALADVQTMHDRMKSILKVIHGAGLDPAAGKAKPEQLILPYDPSFLPEVNLRGLDLDLSNFDLQPERPQSQGSSLLWTKSPETSQAMSHTGNMQLDLPSDDLPNLGGFASETDVPGSVRRQDPLSRLLGPGFGAEEGVLLQPDFEFDEDGNIIELDRRPGDRRTPRQRAEETPVPGEGGGLGIDEMAWDYQPMQLDEEMGVTGANANDANDGETAHAQDKSNSPLDEEVQAGDGDPAESREITVQNARKTAKALLADTRTSLSNKDLTHWNTEYLQTMAIAARQKQQNKLPTQTKKNAAFWVFGQGIGSVGVGVGVSREPHPLKHFAGDELILCLRDGKGKGRKRGQPHDADSHTEGRNVRPRSDDDEVGRGDMMDDDEVMHDDVEIGRHAPSPLREDLSTQMPWNVTASIQSSRHGSSAAQAFRGLAEPTHPRDPLGLGRRSRLTSASPLAGRGFPFDLDNLSIGNEGDLDLDQYLQSELDPEHHTVSADGSAAPMEAVDTPGGQRAKQKLVMSGLDQESQNFLEFLNTKTDAPDVDDAEHEDDEVDPDATEVRFSTLLPPEKTTRVVATQALMHVLTLATKGFLSVRQDPYEDESNQEDGAQYRYGEIFLHL